MNYSPLAAKEPYVEVLMCAIKYYMIKNDATSAELVSTYTLFTGKFYASLYFLYFKFTPKREIMDYIVKDEDNQVFRNMPARHFGLCRV